MTGEAQAKRGNGEERIGIAIGGEHGGPAHIEVLLTEDAAIPIDHPFALIASHARRAHEMRMDTGQRPAFFLRKQRRIIELPQRVAPQGLVKSAKEADDRSPVLAREGPMKLGRRNIENTAAGGGGEADTIFGIGGTDPERRGE